MGLYGGCQSVFMTRSSKQSEVYNNVWHSGMYKCVCVCVCCTAGVSIHSVQRHVLSVCSSNTLLPFKTSKHFLQGFHALLILYLLHTYTHRNISTNTWSKVSMEAGKSHTLSHMYCTYSSCAWKRMCVCSGMYVHPPKYQCVYIM